MEHAGTIITGWYFLTRRFLDPGGLGTLFNA